MTTHLVSHTQAGIKIKWGSKYNKIIFIFLFFTQIEAIKVLHTFPYFYKEQKAVRNAII